MNDDGRMWALSGVLIGAFVGQALRRAVSSAQGIYEVYQTSGDRFDLVGPGGEFVFSSTDLAELQDAARAHAAYRGHQTLSIRQIGFSGQPTGKMLSGSVARLDPKAAPTRISFRAPEPTRGRITFSSLRSLVEKASETVRRPERGLEVVGKETRVFDLADRPWERTYSEPGHGFFVRGAGDTGGWGERFRPGSLFGYAIYYRKAPVVVVRPDGLYELNTRGWKTASTLKKIKKFSPARLSNHFLVRGEGDPTIGVIRIDGEWEELEDGTLVNADGYAVGYLGTPKVEGGVEVEDVTWIAGAPKGSSVRVPVSHWQGEGDQAQQVWKRENFDWFVNFTQGRVDPRRYSVPMVSLGTAEAWEKEYREWGDRRYITLTGRPSRGAKILRPNRKLPDGGFASDLRPLRHSFRNPEGRR